MTPVLDIMAGMLGGTLMGMIWLGHAAVVFAFDPPNLLRVRIDSGGSASTVMAIALGALFSFTALGCVAALVADAAMSGTGGQLAVIPSGLYFAMVVTLVAVAAVPAFGFMRDKITHVAIWLALFAGIYGVLIPNLLLALQNRA